MPYKITLTAACAECGFLGHTWEDGLLCGYQGCQGIFQKIRTTEDFVRAVERRVKHGFTNEAVPPPGLVLTVEGEW